MHFDGIVGDPQIPQLKLDVTYHLQVEECPAAALFRRGDADSSGKIDLTDAVFVLSYLFLGGNGPACMDAADADSSAKIDLTDAVFTLSWLFLGGKDMGTPGPVCGTVPSNFPGSPCPATCK